MTKILRRVGKVIKYYLIALGMFFHLFLVWMAAGWPIFFDRFLIQSDEPEPGQFIVCLTGGLGTNNLPTEDGWGRIYTAVQLYFDNYAPRILFTGGGVEKVSEAEIYAEVAQWFGCSSKAIFYEVGANSTADHPARILEMKEFGITRETPLIIVTSPLHSKRTALCFRKYGFNHFRLISQYRARKISDPLKVRELRTSYFDSFRPSGKRYGDVFMKLRWRTNYFFAALREAVALVAYKVKGYI